MTLLTDLAIRRAKPTDKEYTLKDGGGLFLNIYPNGSKYWLFRFSWNKKQTRLSFGTYPALGLKEARDLGQQARACLANGIDPRTQRKEQQSTVTLIEGEEGLTFNEFVQTWLERKLKKLHPIASKEKKNGGRQSTAIIIERYLRLDMLPLLGHKALKNITRADVLAVQTQIENRNALSIAEKVRGWLNEIFRHAIAMGLIETNPAADLDIVVLPHRRTRNNPHLDMTEIPELLAKIRDYNGDRQTQLGLRLLLLTGVRTGELRFAEPGQFDLQNALWKIPAEDVKQLQRIKLEKDPHIPDYLVPLSRQAVDIVRELLDAMFAAQRYLFCHRSEPRQAVSENTFNGALKRMGYQGRLTGHGIRGTLSTALNELGYNKDWIEAQLSHTDKDRIRATYNHAKYLEQRRAMMQDWADRLDQWEQQNIPLSEPQEKT